MGMPMEVDFDLHDQANLEPLTEPAAPAKSPAPDSVLSINATTLEITGGLCYPGGIAK